MNTKQTHNQESSKKPVQIPDPDQDNITVLTENLPNKPILPWNHYDSPWEEGEREEVADEVSSDEVQEQIYDN